MTATRALAGDTAGSKQRNPATATATTHLMFINHMFHFLFNA
jgi:hypothetical protein